MVKEKENNKSEIERQKGRMTVQRKTKGKDCKEKRTKQEGLQETGFIFRFPLRFPRCVPLLSC
jgi:hypothetical protein